MNWLCKIGMHDEYKMVEVKIDKYLYQNFLCLKCQRERRVRRDLQTFVLESMTQSSFELGVSGGCKEEEESYSA